MKLKLSEAIRLGSLLVENPRRFESSRCAIGMACRAIGKCNEGVEPGDDQSNYDTLATTWPWIKEFVGKCPNCALTMHGYAVVYHFFDRHIIGEASATIEQLADFIASIEPSAPADAPLTHAQLEQEDVGDICESQKVRA